jgi:hypothetical protein
MRHGDRLYGLILGRSLRLRVRLVERCACWGYISGSSPFLSQLYSVCSVMPLVWAAIFAHYPKVADLSLQTLISVGPGYANFGECTFCALGE